MKIVFIALIPLLLSLSNQNSTAQTIKKFPWAGGLNSAQFGEIDINNDGIPDLVVFDRQGDRLLCFVNGGTTGTIDYTYAPQYQKLFPQLYHWAEFKDYNGDGKTDIFTYSPGWAGIIVYKNITTDNLKFKRVVYPYLTSFQGGGYTNIFVTYADYPAICDIDNDGDLDILSFWGLGSFVEMHKNLSMEKYGNADSLDYEKTEYCWGHFAESDESNMLFLDTCIGNRDTGMLLNNRHTGSTFLMIDINADGVKDLLLGDVDYPGLFLLTNDGTLQNAHISAFDTLFPSYDTTVKLFSMPVASYIDVNNDGIKDLLVSPFDPNPFVTQNRKSVWLYINEGENNNPVFKLENKRFLQDNMIDAGSGAYPLFVDWDGDGLTDILLGNYGFYVNSWYDNNFFLHSFYNSHLQFYKNTGTASNPQFQLYDNNLAHLDFEFLLGIYPAAGDLDNDGDMDLLVGNSEGNIIFIENQNGDLVIADKNYGNIDVGEYSTPQLFDLDNDGLTDLIIGEKGGNLNYYHNEGTPQSPDFVFVTDSLGKVNVTDINLSYYGYSTPCFFRTGNGKTVLAVGSEQGKIFYFTDIDNNLDGEFYEEDDEGLNSLLDTNGVNYDRGMRTAVSISDLNNDGKPEMVAGNFSGGLEFFKKNPDVLPYVNEININKTLSFKLFPNPAENTFLIKLSEKQSVNIGFNILNIQGKILKSGTITAGNNKKEVNIQDIPHGVYLVEIHSKRIIFQTKKLLIIK